MSHNNRIISASILSCDFTKIASILAQLAEVEVKELHLDVMDGNFVNNLTFGAGIIKNLRAVSKLFFDAHLMINHPHKLLDDFIKAGCDSITIHREAYPGSSGINQIKETLLYIKQYNIEAGISINPQTPTTEIEQVLDMVDRVLVMSVNPGWGGQQFMPSAVEKIAELDGMRQKYGYKYQIAIDGGINEKSIKLLDKSNVDVIVCGSYLFQDDLQKQIKSLR